MFDDSVHCLPAVQLTTSGRKVIRYNLFVYDSELGKLSALVVISLQPLLCFRSFSFFCLQLISRLDICYLSKISLFSANIISRIFILTVRFKLKIFHHFYTKFLSILKIVAFSTLLFHLFLCILWKKEETKKRTYKDK